MPILPEHAYCGYCGHAFADDIFAQTCSSCKKTTYLNPTLVGLLVLPVDDGVLMIRRRDSGKLAFPGGFIERGESWQVGIARELWEEASIRIDPSHIETYETLSTPNGHLVLLFGLGVKYASAELPDFMPNEECTERLVVNEVQELAFPLHTQVLRKYLQ